MNHEVKEKIDNFVSKGHTVANFGSIDHANYFKAKLAERNISASVIERIGNVYTIDTPAIVKKHFHVEGMKSTTHRVLGKFI